MISTKTLLKMVRKWQNLVVIRRRRISWPKTNADVEVDCIRAPFMADIGHFVVYSDDGRRFVIPLVYLNNKVLRQLLKMSEEEFGLPGDGPITLPCDALLLRRKRISFLRNNVDGELDSFGTPFLADKGQFVVYSDDGRRFVIPLVFLNNEVLRQLLKMSEEEFGLPGDGPITLPCDAFLM
ncbi:hypothetical protein RJ639_024242 [Escallonia herrerae]|uniref:Small auxin up regulated protein n=1 Tax=Escallonia herrerae TaxID=1293975 RepID=A0AA89ADQ6_9ASTE|nr:hypothetical protein RJ639_024242 [Escallonia herrerae]